MQFPFEMFFFWIFLGDLIGFCPFSGVNPSPTLQYKFTSGDEAPVFLQPTSAWPTHCPACAPWDPEGTKRKEVVFLQAKQQVIHIHIWCITCEFEKTIRREWVYIINVHHPFRLWISPLFDLETFAAAPGHPAPVCTASSSSKSKEAFGGLAWSGCVEEVL